MYCVFNFSVFNLLCLWFVLSFNLMSLVVAFSICHSFKFSVSFTFVSFSFYVFSLLRVFSFVCLMCVLCLQFAICWLILRTCVEGQKEDRTNEELHKT
jgi:hypothetical protein